MFTQIKTSAQNKEIVVALTRKLNLGAENVIARLAFSYSINKSGKLDLSNIKDSRGKEYSKGVLFGEFSDIYVGMLCTLYGIYKTDKDLGKYVKMHVDNGLELLNTEISTLSNLDGFDFLSDKIQENLLHYAY